MPNRLAGETSPYLRQHATTRWTGIRGARRRSTARGREDKPILLSIGYSACHWCHVMAHESFEDPAVAAVMNELFVNVKVDREERPDLDQIYQTAHALLTRRRRRLAADDVPDARRASLISAAPISPRRRATACPASPICCRALPRAYREQGAAIAEQNARLTEALAQHLDAEPREAAAALPARRRRARSTRTRSDLRPGRRRLRRAPKFPHAGRARLLPARVRGAARRRTRCACVRVTLERMAEGGIYDQLGGGFCRYSVDGEWTIPHFEKMLYDNGAAAGALRRCLARSPAEPAYRDVARGNVGWLRARNARAATAATIRASMPTARARKASSTSGPRDEVRGALTADEYAVAARSLGLDGRRTSSRHAWHLRVTAPLDRDRRRAGHRAADARLRLEARARQAVRGARRARAPGRDDKILTSWNALMIGRWRARRALFARRRLARTRASRRSIRSVAAAVARRSAVRDLQGRARASATPISTTTPSCSRRCSS